MLGNGRFSWDISLTLNGCDKGQSNTTWQEYKLERALYGVVQNLDDLRITTGRFDQSVAWFNAP